MKHAQWLALSASFGLAVSFAAGTAVANAASTAVQPHRITLRGSLTPATERAHSAGAVAANTRTKVAVAEMVAFIIVRTTVLDYY